MRITAQELSAHRWKDWETWVFTDDLGERVSISSCECSEEQSGFGGQRNREQETGVLIIMLR